MLVDFLVGSTVQYSYAAPLTTYCAVFMVFKQAYCFSSVNNDGIVLIIFQCALLGVGRVPNRSLCKHAQ